MRCTIGFSKSVFKCNVVFWHCKTNKQNPGLKGTVHTEMKFYSLLSSSYKALWVSFFRWTLKKIFWRKLNNNYGSQLFLVSKMSSFEFKIWKRWRLANDDRIYICGWQLFKWKKILINIVLLSKYIIPVAILKLQPPFQYLPNI